MGSRIFCRNFSRLKCLYGLIGLLLIILIIFVNEKHQLCDPKEHLAWFCPWPDPDLTICKWNEHFPKPLEQLS